MNVTCERCNTEYDFDDTLVSGRGTTVKCTNCGHLFKVRKKSADPAAAPEKWVVRTVDGRELQFNALRELQAAITARTIGREDVLSRGGSRPRRLGAITELEPFFATVTGGAAAAPHTTTAPGLGTSGLGSSGLGTSGVGTPAAGSPPGRTRSATPQGTPAVKLPSAHGADEAVVDSSDMQDDQTVVRPNPVVEKPKAPDIAADKMFPAGGKPGDKALGRSTTKEVSPPPARPPAKDPSPLPGKLPERTAGARSPTPPKGTPPPSPQELAAMKGPEKGAAKPPAREKEISPPPGKLPDKLPARPPLKDGPGRTSTASQAPQAPESKEKESKPEAGSGPSVLPTQRSPGDAAAPTAAAATSPGKRPMPPGVPTPGKDVKISHVGEDEPRAATATKTVSTKRPGGGQRIIAFVAAGVLLFVGYKAVQLYVLPKPPPPAPAADERIPTFLKDAEKALNEGDIAGAQSLLDKASGLAEKDPRVAAEQARIAAVQADFKWLRLRLLPIGDPEQPLIQRELDAALERAKKAVANAQAIAPDDPAVTRRRIDLLRMSGNLDEARKLVAGLPGAGSQPESALVLAALDLAEEKPSWPSVIERLRTAVVGEQSIGRARSMLIYALVRSGDITGAKAEYDQLTGMPRPHPLLPPLREFISRNEAPAADAGVDGGDLTPEEAIRQANELRAKGEPKKAEEILQDVLKKHPTNADAAVGLAEISRARNDMGTATRFYEQALKNNPAHLAALTGLADIKWDANDRQAALPLYRKVVEVGGSTSYVAHARTRLGGPIPDDFITTPPPTVPSPTYTAPTYTAPPPPATTPTAAPPPTPTETTPPPPPTPTTPPPPPPTNTHAPPIDFEGP
jgi:predicted Zn finger-like uncharacterized protein